jgi:hypothetical protein
VFFKQRNTNLISTNGLKYTIIRHWLHAWKIRLSFQSS